MYSWWSGEGFPAGFSRLCLCHGTFCPPQSCTFASPVPCEDRRCWFHLKRQPRNLRWPGCPDAAVRCFEVGFFFVSDTNYGNPCKVNLHWEHFPTLLMYHRFPSAFCILENDFFPKYTLALHPRISRNQAGPNQIIISSTWTNYNFCETPLTKQYFCFSTGGCVLTGGGLCCFEFINSVQMLFFLLLFYFRGLC